MATTRDARAKMATTVARMVFMVSAGDEAERVAKCRLTHGPTSWPCRHRTEAGMSMLSSEIGKV
jgi:hypothetical protein